MSGAIIRESCAADKDILIDTNEAPACPFVIRRQFDVGQQIAVAWIEDVTPVPLNDINAISGDDVVGASSISTGDMDLVVRSIQWGVTIS